MDLEEGVTYRLVCGLAADLAEADQANFSGRWRSHAAAGGSFVIIYREVLGRIGGREGDVELIREAVEDALTGRRPRW